jgi:hypothetical protein
VSVKTRVAVLVAIVAAVLLAGCGSGAAGSSDAKRHVAARTPASNPPTQTTPGLGPSVQTVPTPGPTGIPAEPGAVAVIRAWSSALRRGDVRGAARYFALPSVMINGPDANGNVVVVSIRSAADARAANSSLPCGAVFISADQRGRYVNALFRLTNRAGPGGGCAGGAGVTARTNFVIRRGRIAEWIRAPDDPGDNPGPASPGPQTNPQTSGPAV